MGSTSPDIRHSNSDTCARDTISWHSQIFEGRIDAIIMATSNPASGCSPGYSPGCSVFKTSSSRKNGKRHREDTTSEEEQWYKYAQQRVSDGVQPRAILKVSYKCAFEGCSAVKVKQRNTTVSNPKETFRFHGFHNHGISRQLSAQMLHPENSFDDNYNGRRLKRKYHKAVSGSTTNGVKSACQTHVAAPPTPRLHLPPEETTAPTHNKLVHCGAMLLVPHSDALVEIMGYLDEECLPQHIGGPRHTGLACATLASCMDEPYKPGAAGNPPSTANAPSASLTRTASDSTSNAPSASSTSTASDTCTTTSTELLTELKNEVNLVDVVIGLEKNQLTTRTELLTKLNKEVDLVDVVIDLDEELSSLLPILFEV